MIAEIAVNLPLLDCFDYKIPPQILNNAKPGCRVLIPFQNRKIVGVITKIKEKSDFKRVKSLISLIDDKPLFKASQMAFTKWIAEYYLCGWGEVLNGAIPAGLNIKIEKRISLNLNILDTLQTQHISELKKIEGHTASILEKTNPLLPPKQINSLIKSGVINFEYVLAGQKVAASKEKIVIFRKNAPSSLKKGSNAERLCRLIQENEKITKRELRAQISNFDSIYKKLEKEGYLSTISQAVPSGSFTPLKSKEEKESFLTLNEEQEVALKTIKASIVEKRFGVFLLHGVTGSGKTEVYMHCVLETINQSRRVLILLPEISLTPQTLERFQKRFGDVVAVQHSQMTEKQRYEEWRKIYSGNIKIVIGARSALFSPIEDLGLIVIDEEHDSSFKQNESPFYNARDCSVKLAKDLNIPVILGSATPSIESYQNTINGKYKLIELKKRAGKSQLPNVKLVNLANSKRVRGVFYLSNTLYKELQTNFREKRQAIIFLNRRGYSALISCKNCETPVLCDNCSTAMTWHKKQRTLVCHHCFKEKKIPRNCLNCGSEKFNEEGLGTQRVEEDLKSLFPNASFLRVDRDTIRNTRQLNSALNEIKKNNVDFVIGTQLISKGHDFPNIGIVAILLADSSLNIPDFRSSERTFQLVSQVSGRGGRKSEQSKSLVQSFNTKHFVLESAKSNDYLGFFNQEIKHRETLNNPPFFRVIQLKISSENESKSLKSAKNLSLYLREILLNYADISLFGPIEAPIYKVNKRFYWHLVLKSTQGKNIKKVSRICLKEQKNWMVGSTRVSIDVDPYF